MKKHFMDKITGHVCVFWQIQLLQYLTNKVLHHLVAKVIKKKQKTKTTYSIQQSSSLTCNTIHERFYSEILTNVYCLTVHMFLVLTQKQLKTETLCLCKGTADTCVCRVALGCPFLY